MNFHPLTRIIAAFLTFLFPVYAMSQAAQLTERLGRTVLYEEVSLSPDGARVAWVQTTAAGSSTVIHIARTSGPSQAKPINLGTMGVRVDSILVWSPDSRSLAFFSASGECAQAQIWSVSAEAAPPRKRTHLKGYAARPRWSHDG